MKKAQVNGHVNTHVHVDAESMQYVINIYTQHCTKYVKQHYIIYVHSKRSYVMQMTISIDLPLPSLS